MTGHEGEKLSEFFDFDQWPDKMARKVTRAELLAVLDRWYRVNESQKWWRRLWRFLKAQRGSGPVTIPEEKPPTPEAE
jgi:hypothetical protein